MPSVVEVECPNCEKTLKVPPAVFGKKVKCKHCEHAFVVRDPDEKPAAKAAKPAKPAAKAEESGAKPSPPTAPVPVKKPFDDDDEGPSNIDVIKEDETPRCPHCAQELDPPDAKVCLHCGFNNLTREKADRKKVWAPTFEDWAKHLGPGIIALIVVIALLVLDVVSFLKMREWLEGTDIEMDEKDAAGRKKFYVHPAFFKFLILGITVPIIIPAAKLAFRRLVKNYMPPEKIKK